MYLEDVLVGQLAGGKGVAHAAGVDHREVGFGLCHQGAPDHHGQRSGLAAHHGTVTFKPTVGGADFDQQLLLAEFLIGLEQGQHFRMLRDFRRVGDQAGLAVGGLHLPLQVDRYQRIFDQFELAIAVLEISPPYVFAPFVRLHDPAAVLAVRPAFGARHVFAVQHVLGLHASRVLRVAAHDQVNALDSSRHFHIAFGLGAMVAVFVVPHVGGCNHDIGLAAQLGNHLGCFADDAAELDALDVVRAYHFERVFGGQPHHADAQATQREDLVGLEHPLPAVINVRRQHRELGKVALHAQDAQRLVELMIADGHRVISQQVHAAEIGYCVLQVGFGDPGIDVTAIEQQAVTAGLRHFRADAIDYRFARRHSVLAVAVLPEAAVVVIGVQDGDLVGLVFLRAASLQGRACRQRSQAG